MIKLNRFTRSISALLLVVAIFCSSLSLSAQAQRTAATKPQAAPQEFSCQLAAIEKAIDDKRIELGIPGLSLVIVKDDHIIYMKGLGYKDFEKKIPVTADTLFAIGSASKAFTSMLALMGTDEGKLSLEDSPKKFLPYFKLSDPDADAKITLRDLLSHRSGLNRTDLAMVTGVLNRQELIQVAAMAKPTAKLGEKFQYQNIMYAAAGEAVARAENSTWDTLIETKIFKPLGMKASNTTVVAMQKSRDFSFGYEYNSTTKVTRRLPQREISYAAPAGAINSNARDMVQWLRFMLSGGTVNGKRLISEKAFTESISKQMNVAGSIDYGLGWFLRQWNKHKVVDHGGNIDGFNSQVAFMPDQKLGFALLTNVTASSLGPFATNTIWQNLVNDPNLKEEKVAGPASDPKLEAGNYRLASAGVSFEVTFKDNKLTLFVPGQSPYPLENLGGRRYKLADPAPAGFYATFRPIKGKESETEMFLEQPQGNLILPKVMATESTATTSAAGDSLSIVVGSYENESSKQVIEIGMREGKVSLLVPGQPPYPLTESEKNKLRSPGLPETYWIEVVRDGADKVSGIVLNQPEGRFSFRRVPSNLISADELLTKMIAAYGGEEALRKHKSSVTTVAIDFENQGVKAEGQITARAPNSALSDIRLMALGKQIATSTSYFDGNTGGEVVSFAPEETYTGKRLDDVRTASDFYDVLNWKKNYKSIVVKRKAKIGDEEVYIVERKSEKGTPVTDYVSTKTFLVLKRESVIASETSGVELPETQMFSDYRMVDGVMVPYKLVSSNVAYGNIVMIVKDMKWDVAIPDSAFQKPPVKK